MCVTLSWLHAAPSSFHPGLAARSLQCSYGTVAAASCDSLPSVLQLTNVSNSLTVDNNFQLANLSLPNLAYVGAKLSVGSSLPAATSCSQVGPGTQLGLHHAITEHLRRPAHACCAAVPSPSCPHPQSAEADAACLGHLAAPPMHPATCPMSPSAPKAAWHLYCCAVQGPPQQNFNGGPFYAALQVSAPNLAIVGSGLSVTWNVASLSAPNLTALDNDFKGLTAFPTSLAVGGGDLRVACTLELQTLTLPALQTASSIQVEQCGRCQVSGLWLLSQGQDIVWSGSSACCEAENSSNLREGTCAASNVAVRPVPCCSWCKSRAAQSASWHRGPAACAPGGAPAAKVHCWCPALLEVTHQSWRSASLTSSSLPAGHQQHSPDLPQPPQHQAAGRATCRPVQCHCVQRQSPAAGASQPQGSGARHCSSCSCGAPTWLTVRFGLQQLRQCAQGLDSSCQTNLTRSENQMHCLGAVCRSHRPSAWTRSLCNCLLSGPHECTGAHELSLLKAHTHPRIVQQPIALIAMVVALFAHALYLAPAGLTTRCTAYLTYHCCV